MALAKIYCSLWYSLFSIIGFILILLPYYWTVYSNQQIQPMLNSLQALHLALCPLLLHPQTGSTRKHCQSLLAIVWMKMENRAWSIVVCPVSTQRTQNGTNKRLDLFHINKKLNYLQDHWLLNTFKFERSWEIRAY